MAARLILLLNAPQRISTGRIAMRTPGSNGAETWRNLRSAAIRLLSEHGYEAMNLRMLAKTIGVQVGSLYNYIESKQQLLFWLLKEGVEGLLNQFDEWLA